MLDEAMNAAGVLPGLTFVPVRARATAQGEQETDGKPAPPAGATGDAHGTTSASAGEGGGGGGGSGGSGGNAGSASPPRDGNASDRHAAATPGSQRTPSGQPRPHTAWMGESWDDPDGEDDQASLAMLQQLMAVRPPMIGQPPPNPPPRPRPEPHPHD